MGVRVACGVLVGLRVGFGSSLVHAAMHVRKSPNGTLFGLGHFAMQSATGARTTTFGVAVGVGVCA
jgi:hypothetical protein